MAIPVYLAGNPVTLTVPLVDLAGNSVSASSASYVVNDMNDATVVPSTPVPSFISGATEATITVSATINTLAAIPAASAITNNQIGEYNTRELRTIVVTFLDSFNNTYIVKSSYGLEQTDPLIAGLNSFQTLPQAELAAMDIVNTSAWDAAANNDKVAAMIEAWWRITQLNFWLLNSNVNWAQDNLNYIPDGVYQSPYASDGQQMFIFNGNLALLTPTQYNALPYRFKNVLKLAQVCEADYLLGGNQIDLIRQQGILLDVTGETRQAFRNVKALDLPVSKRALKYLSQFITFSKRIGRS